MRTLFFCLFLLVGLQPLVWAQTTIGVEPIDKLVAAMQTQSVAVVQPYLLAETQVSGLPTAYTAQVLAQMLPRFKKAENSRLIRQTTEGVNTRYVVALTQNGVEKEYDVLVTPANKLLEINLLKAEAKRIDTRFGAQDLTTPAEVVMPMRVQNGLLIVTAEVDGQRGDFFLDLGAPALLLNKTRFGSSASGSTVAARQLRGVNGAGSSFDYYHATDFNWQGISFQNRDVPTLDLTDLARRAGVSELLGLIGYNLLEQYALTLDYAAQTVTLRKPTPTASAEGLPFILRGHLPVVEALVAGHTLRLALDCGAQQNLLDARFAATFASQLRKSETVQLAGADQKARSVTSGELRKLQLVHGPTFRNQPTVFASISHLNQKPDQVVLDGLLGYPMLRQQRTTIDYVNKVVRFEGQ
ncbi:aspartyl protease family protein [Hymenobacter profundi]|uniref:Retropepsin-like domain-containing protein n=1 Tax=Hymenobacter profundi TaxID=1982110 RepID=A0ABS6WVK6_9BACT|nr:aspartyl protease family protein [Hymenobacter profundi]MBW3127640.1 retropepsin-like domain-containing protein [Hymenobacter profundi]